jgi:FtsZ-binding cell division protein ZapB/exonuclease VII small subunit
MENSIMLDTIKIAIEKSQQHLDDIIASIETHYNDAAEDGAKLWQQTKPTLQHLRQSLDKAQQSLHSQTDEGRLQLHLATMDAHDQWQQLSEAITGLAKRSQPKVQQAVLQSYLAKMEARDFINTQGKVISQDFQQAREKLEQSSQRAASEMNRSFERVAKLWGE